MPTDNTQEGVERVEKIARAFHDEYEAFAEAYEWRTQESTRVAFDELPEANRGTMISTVRSLLERHLIYPADHPAVLSSDEARLLAGVMGEYYGVHGLTGDFLAPTPIRELYDRLSTYAEENR
jgi:hypothetical protein